ncbi:MAG TPA: tail fiber domain-containing protein [Lunatimonas sp.]|nr:tail fiber domain-containing protein [Lunatimonas sp.]
MANRSRSYLFDRFEDGARPTGSNFSDLIDSAINKVDDNIQLDTNGNLTIPAGLNLSNATNGQEGTLRFSAGQVEVFSAGTWGAIAGEGGGAFVPVPDGNGVAFAGGNVGIGEFPEDPANRLDVPLAANLPGGSEQVRLGNTIFHNGPLNDAAYLAHRNNVNSENYAVRQDSLANTALNSGSSATLSLRQNNVVRMQITNAGNITMSPSASINLNGNTALGSPTQNRNLSVFGNINVTGNINATGSITPGPSDMRLKQDTKPLEIGLKELIKLKTVTFKYNGKGGTPEDGKERIGLIAQDIQKVIPSMVIKSQKSEDDDVEYLSYDTQPLFYIMINAIQELEKRVKKLESQLAAKSK